VCLSQFYFFGFCPVNIAKPSIFERPLRQPQAKPVVKNTTAAHFPVDRKNHRPTPIQVGTLCSTGDDLPFRNRYEVGSHNYTQGRYRFKFPQYSPSLGDMLSKDDDNQHTKLWRKTDFTFMNDKIYSIARFNATTRNKRNINGTSSHSYNSTLKTIQGDTINEISFDEYSDLRTVGMLVEGIADSLDDDDDGQNDVDVIEEGIPFNREYLGLKLFGANWMNLCIYFPQFARNGATRSRFSELHVNTNFNKARGGGDYHFLTDNTQPIAAGDINTIYFARNDLHWTDFIEVPVSHIVRMFDYNVKGFKHTEAGIPINEIFYYRNGQNSPSWGGSPCPVGGGKTNGLPSNPVDGNVYFYKGFGAADCIRYLVELGIVTIPK